MSLEKLNELLAKAVAGLQAEALTLVELDPKPFKPWLPESYWREQDLLARADAARIMDLAKEAEYRKACRRRQDEHLAYNIDVDAVLNDGLALDKTKLPDGWASTTMEQSLRWGSARSARPTQGNPQPAYTATCVGCGRPITKQRRDRWHDHAGKVTCTDDLCDYPHDKDQTSAVNEFHTYHRDTDIEPEDDDDDDDW